MANWEATVAALEPLLQGRPRLTQELLARPPFRYLTDVVSQLQGRTGFPAAGLFGPEAADARAMDKDAKLQYLERLSSAITACTGQPVVARPSKIVAGLEPEATNVMLQQLAAAATLHTSGGGGGSVARASAAHTGAAATAQPSPSPVPVAARAAVARASSDGSEAAAPGAPPCRVVFAKQQLEALLPQLARRLGEARAALSGRAAPAAGSSTALACCHAMAGVAAEAAALARVLEALQAATSSVAAECAAWGREGDKLAAQLKQEERAEAAAAVTARGRLAQLDADVSVARQRLAAAMS